MINPQMMQMLMQLRQNPASVLGQYGIPQDIANDPQKVIQHLMNSGRISQAQYDTAVRMVNNMQHLK